MDENFTPEDREKRKEALAKVLSVAADAGMVPATPVKRIADFLTSRDLDLSTPTPAATPVEAGLTAEPDAPVEDSEAPRFVRGFHDILISIGLVVLLGGLWGLSGFWGLKVALALMAAVVVLAEILVRRQRLAVSAFVLTGAFSIAALIGAGSLFYRSHSAELELQIISTLPVATILISVFYWRYRVPVAFAGFVSAGYATGLIAAFWAIGFWYYPKNYISLLPGIHSILMFATALWFDLKDRERKTRRSDMAFWLFLVAAVMMFFAVNSAIFHGQTLSLSYLFFGYSLNQWHGVEISNAQVTATAATSATFIMIGILLDRRVFLISTVVSPAYLIYLWITSGLTAGALPIDRIIFVTLLLIGIVVLSLGIGWQVLRRLIVGRLPQSWQARLPPVRG